MQRQLLADEGSCELYVRLLCQFEPAAVLPFLQSHDSYRYVVVPLSLHLLRAVQAWTPVDRGETHALQPDTMRYEWDAGWNSAWHGATSMGYGTGRHTSWSTTWATTPPQCG